MDGGTEGGRRRYQNRALSPTGVGNREAYMQQGLHWLEHDSVALEWSYQAVSVAEQYHGRVAMRPAAELARRGLQPLDLGGRQILAGAN